MKTIQVNIGLNNNSFTSSEVIDYMASLKDYRLMAYYIKDMTFQGNVEPTFVGVLEYKYSRQSKVLSDFENIASVMTQECIAISTDYFEALAFNPSYSGEGYRFNPELFEYIRLTKFEQDFRGGKRTIFRVETKDFKMQSGSAEGIQRLIDDHKKDNEGTF
jgi:hypothetical protein